MSRIDLHPEDLADLQQEGSLTEREEQILEEHLEQCSACAFEQVLREDFAAELQATPDDDEVVDRVLDRVVPSRRLRSPGRRSNVLAWVAAAAAVLLVTVGASATVWTFVSGWVESRSDTEATREQDQPPEPSSPSKSRRSRHVDDNVSQTNDEEPPDETVEEPESTDQPEEQLDDHPGLAVQATAPPPSASELFARANEARRAQRNAEAVNLFRKLGRTYPGSREEIASRVSLGRLLLDRLNDPRGALRLFDNYLVASPNGTLAQEARVGRALCLRRLGRNREEARAWRAILERHPNSIHSRRARHRLEELGHPQPAESLDQ
jgi:TolA-binding protein